MSDSSADPDGPDLAARHRALIARDREIGLMAEAESARAHAERVEAALAETRHRLARKNDRITRLRARVVELEAAVPSRPSLRRRLGRARRGDAVD